PGWLLGWAQAFDQVRLQPDEDSLESLALSAGWNLGAAAVGGLGGLWCHKLGDLLWMGERVVLSVRSTLAHTAAGTFAERWLGGAAEERRLGPFGGKTARRLLGEAGGQGGLAARP